MPCGFVNDSINFQPNWNIITRSNDGSVISNVTVTPNQINSDNSDRLVYEPDLTSGPNNAANNRLLVGPVDETYNQSSYQCTFDLAGGDVISSIGTITVAGEYEQLHCCIYMDTWHIQHLVLNKSIIINYVDAIPAHPADQAIIFRRYIQIGHCNEIVHLSFQFRGATII